MAIRLISIFIILVFAFSCSAPRYELDIKQTRASDILHHISSEQQKFKSFSGEGRITVESEEFSGNFFASILYNEHDSLLIKIVGPLGINLGNLFIGKSRFVMYSQMSNQFYSGNIEDFANQNFLQFPLKISELKEFVIGNEPINNMKIEQFSVQDDMFYLNSFDGSLTYDIWIDNKIGKIRKINYQSGSEQLLQKQYDDFERVNDLFFPRQIRLLRPTRNQAVSIYYNSFVLNKKIEPDKFTINIPETAKQIDLFLEEMN